MLGNHFILNVIAFQSKAESLIEFKQRRFFRTCTQIAFQYIPGQRQRAREIEIIIQLSHETINISGIGCTWLTKGVYLASQAVERCLRRQERVEIEAELAAIVPRKAEIAIVQRIVSFVAQQLQPQEFSLRLSHFFS